MVNPDAGNLKEKVVFVFGGLGLIATIGSYFYIPEMKGKTFAGIDILFASKVPPRKMGKVQLEQQADVWKLWKEKEEKDMRKGLNVCHG